MPPERLRVVRELIAECWSNHRIEWALSEKFNVTRRTIREYIKRVNAEMAEEANELEDLPTRRNRMREKLEAHYAKCIAAGQLSAAGQTLERLMKLDGLHADRLELSGPAGAPVALSVRQEVSLDGWAPDEVELLERALLRRSAS